MRLVNSASVELRSISWLWKGRIPMGVVTLVEGDPGTSKSTLTATMCAHISTGKDWPDGTPCPQGKAILANAEDLNEEIIAPRLEAAKADRSKVFILTPNKDDPKEVPFTIPDSVGALEETIVSENVKLVVFDPLEAYLSDKTNNYSNQSMRKALRTLEHLAQRVNCSVIVVRHLNKDSGKSPTYRGGGSIGIIGAARAAMLVSRDPANKDRCLMVPHKANWSALKDGIAYRTEDTSLVGPHGDEIHTSRIVWDGEVAISAQDVLHPQGDLAEGIDLSDAATFLRNALKDGPRLSSEVFDEGVKQGLSKKTLFRAAKMINVIKKPAGTGKDQRWLWELEADITSAFLE